VSAGAAASADGVRLQKVLAAAGVGSRRACEALIAQGRVEVDGAVVTVAGTRIDPDRAVVRVDGRRVNVRKSGVYLALNKPPGVLSAMSDQWGRPTVGDFVADRPQRLFHVGRLDRDSEGLLLLTDDGDLAHKLAHPSYGIPKRYLAEVPAPIGREVSRRLRAGVMLEDGPARVDAFHVVQADPARALVEVVLHEGRNRIVRRLLAEVGHPVSHLVRTAIGPIRLGQQRPGTVRELSPAEVADLFAAVDSETGRSPNTQTGVDLSTDQRDEIE
jgi:23S rRNA pseudouridine2605 synthase